MRHGQQTIVVAAALWLAFVASAAGQGTPQQQVANFAGGCFWCV